MTVPGDRLSKEIFSSDFAMQHLASANRQHAGKGPDALPVPARYAFAARGWRIEPWEETAQTLDCTLGTPQEVCGARQP